MVATATALFFTAISFILESAAHGRRITCACTTSECDGHGMDTCTTASVCFTQFLDREDGRDPIIRGCIESRTPLLCQNQRPAVPAKASWPVLLCCNRTMCNGQHPNLPLLLLSTVKSDTESTGEPSEDRGWTTSLYEEDAAEPRGVLHHPDHVIVLAAGVAIVVAVTVSGVAALIAARRRRHAANASFCVKTGVADDDSG